MFDPRLPRIPRKGRSSRTWLARYRLKIDKLVVSSCSGSEINRRDGLTRAWNHSRVPFCPNGNRSNQDQKSCPYSRGSFRSLGSVEDKTSTFLPFLFFFQQILLAPGSLPNSRIIIRLNNDWLGLIVKRKWISFLILTDFDRKSNEFCKEIVEERWI